MIDIRFPDKRFKTFLLEIGIFRDFSGEGIFIISLLSVARGAAEPPFANPAALQAAECLTPQAPERLLYVANTFCVIK